MKEKISKVYNITISTDVGTFIIHPTNNVSMSITETMEFFSTTKEFKIECEANTMTMITY